MSSRESIWIYIYIYIDIYIYIYIKFDHFFISNQLNNELWRLLPAAEPGSISNLIMSELRFNSIMRSKGSGWIHIKFCYFSIKDRLNNELQRLNLDLYIKSNNFWIQNQTSNELYKLRLDPYQILIFLSHESIKEWAPVAQSRSISFLIISWIRIS